MTDLQVNALIQVEVKDSSRLPDTGTGQAKLMTGAALFIMRRSIQATRTGCGGWTGTGSREEVAGHYVLFSAQEKLSSCPIRRLSPSPRHPGQLETPIWSATCSLWRSLGDGRTGCVRLYAWPEGRPTSTLY